MIYIGLCNCILSKLKTDNILLLNITHIFFRVLRGRHVKMQGSFLHLVRCYVPLINITVFLYVTPCSLVEKHQNFTETLASNSAEDERGKLVRNGASLTDHTALQPTKVIFSHLLPESAVTGVPYDSVHIQDHILHPSSLGTAFCHLPVNKHIILNSNPPPISHTTVCAVSNVSGEALSMFH